MTDAEQLRKATRRQQEFELSGGRRRPVPASARRKAEAAALTAQLGMR